MKTAKFRLASGFKIWFLGVLLLSSLALAATPGPRLSTAAFLRAYAPILRGAHALAKDPAAYRASLARDPLALPQDAESGIGIFARGLAELRRSLDADAGLRAQTRAEMEALVGALGDEKVAEKNREKQKQNRKKTRLHSIHWIHWKPFVTMDAFNSVFYANERISLSVDNHSGDGTSTIHVARPGQAGSSFTVTAKGGISAGILSPDGKTVYLGTYDGELIERDLSDPENLSLGHVTEVQAGSLLEEFVFSPDGKYLAFEGTKGNTRTLVWDVQVRKQIYAAESRSPWGFSLRFSPDSRALVLTGSEGNLDAHHLPSGPAQNFFEDGAYSGTVARPGMRSASAYSSDGKSLLSISLPNKYSSAVNIRDAETLELARSISFKGDFSRAAFSRDGRYLVAFVEHKLSDFRMLDLETGREVGGQLNLTFIPYQLEFRDQDSVIYVHSADGYKSDFLPGQTHVFKVDDLVKAYEDS
jgi:hypothetical protein